MSEVPQGPGWWRASDGRWYPPEQRPLPPRPLPEGMFYPPMAYAPSPATNGMAIASMVLGILWLYWVGSILALIFGYIALRQIQERGEAGRGMAIAGVVLGWIGIGTLAIVIVIVIVAVVHSHSATQVVTPGWL